MPLLPRYVAVLERAPDDLGDVVAAVDAASSADPRPRYVVGSGAAQTITGLVDALAGLHDAELARTGVRID
jgi:nucleoside-diphosphate-sugar epimerase